MQNLSLFHPHLQSSHRPPRRRTVWLDRLGYLGEQRLSFSILSILSLTFVLTLIVSRQECVVHMDGAEEDLHDELENVCSDDSKLLKTHGPHSVNSGCNLTWPCCEFVLIPGFICPLSSLDDSDCSSPSTVSVILQPG